jgi:hypothetical protein
MITACFRAFDTAILLDSLEADRENVRAGHELDSDITHHPMLVGVPPVLAREGLRASALGAEKGAQQDDEEEREFDLPIPKTRPCPPSRAWPE